MKNFNPSESFFGNQFEQSSADTVQEHTRDLSKPQTKDMLVLGELNRGTKNFENIKKNTGLDSNDLNSILEDLEKRDLLMVKQKQGLFGTKVELYATEKGFKEYYS